MGPCVLQVIPTLDQGGAERTTIEVALALVAAGGRALVASAGGGLEGELAAAGGVLHRMPLASKNPLTIWANAGRLAALARAEGVDLIHARSRAPAWSALAAARRLGLPFVTTYHGVYNARSPLKRWYNGVMARGDLVIANSHFTAAHLIAAHGTDPARVVIIPRGVDLARFDPAAVGPERAGALATAWALDADDPRPVVMLPGRLTGWKGQGLLLDAIPFVAASARYVLVGGGAAKPAFEAALRARVAAEGLPVTFAGHCADMPAALALADLVVCPSLEPEAFGRTAIEAQAMARPVIAADHGGARETVLPGETGWLTAPGDAGALACAMSQGLALSKAQRLEIGARGRAHVAQHFSTAALQQATLGVYRRLLEPRS
jgi:glycosyltransferase involved in cell wall biosynthesis